MVLSLPCQHKPRFMQEAGQCCHHICKGPHGPATEQGHFLQDGGNQLALAVTCVAPSLRQGPAGEDNGSSLLLPQFVPWAGPTIALASVPVGVPCSTWKAECRAHEGTFCGAREACSVAWGVLWGPKLHSCLCVCLPHPHFVIYRKCLATFTLPKTEEIWGKKMKLKKKSILMKETWELRHTEKVKKKTQKLNYGSHSNCDTVGSHFYVRFNLCRNAKYYLWAKKIIMETAETMVQNILAFEYFKYEPQCINICTLIVCWFVLILHYFIQFIKWNDLKWEKFTTKPINSETTAL